ncbi:MAG: hypothetical protein ACREGD_00330 [Candidatus Saccharimonadales bacterium]
MDALVLGGNNPHNKEWVQQLKSALAPLFNTIATHDYAHWASGGSTIDFDHELRAAVAEARSLNDYVIIAKSVGTLLSLRGTASNSLRPSKAIFLGMPLNYIRQQAMEHESESWLKKTTAPMLFIQNAHDPVASASELERYLKIIVSPSLVNLVELPGNTHDYTDFPKLFELVQRFAAPAG